MIVRKEQPQDVKAITRINNEVFESEAEARLIEELRQKGKITFASVFSPLLNLA